MVNTEIYAGGEGRELLHHVMLGSVYYCVEGEAKHLRLHCNKNASCITALDRISPSIHSPTQKNCYARYFQHMWVFLTEGCDYYNHLHSVRMNPTSCIVNQSNTYVSILKKEIRNTGVTLGGG